MIIACSGGVGRGTRALNYGRLVSFARVLGPYDPCLFMRSLPPYASLPPSSPGPHQHGGIESGLRRKAKDLLHWHQAVLHSLGGDLRGEKGERRAWGDNPSTSRGATGDLASSSSRPPLLPSRPPPRCPPRLARGARPSLHGPAGADSLLVGREGKRGRRRGRVEGSRLRRQQATRRQVVPVDAWSADPQDDTRRE